MAAPRVQALGRLRQRMRDGPAAAEAFFHVHRVEEALEVEQFRLV